MTAPLRARPAPKTPNPAALVRSRSAAPRFAPGEAPALAQFVPRPEPQRTRRTPPIPPAPLHLVDPAAERHRRLTRALTAALVVGICAGLFAIVALRVLLAQGQVDVDRLEATVDRQLAAQQRLHLTVAELEAPAQIVAAARTRLGMVNPGVIVTLAPPPAPAR